MKKIVAILLFLIISTLSFSQDVEFELLENSPSEMRIRVTFPDYSLNSVQVDGEEMHEISMGNAYPIDNEGYPQFLKSTTSIIISEENNLPDIEVVDEDFILIDNFKLAPSRGKIYRNIDPNTIAYRKGSAYSENRFLGDNQGVLGEFYQLRDFKGVSIAVSPFAYNPVSETLKLYRSMVLVVHFPQINNISVAHKNTSSYHQVYQKHFLNYTLNRATPLDEEGELLILAPDNFVNALQPLKEWKIKCGIPTEIVPLSVAGTTKTAVKSFITNYYNNHNLAYVIAVGDHAQFPPYIMNTGWYTAAADNYYAEVAGGDKYPDFFFSKLSASTIEQVETQVAKILMYEQVTGETSHYTTTCGIASQEGPGDAGEYDFQHIRNIQNQLLNFTYTDMYELYEGSQGGNDASGYPNATLVSQAVNAGVGIINYCGHGDYNMWVTSSFNSNHVNQLTNYNKLPIIISTACVNGEYNSKTCFAETWLWAKKDDQLTGAAGTVMSTINQAWNPPMCGQDQMIDLLTEMNPNLARRTFGGIVFGGLFKILDQYYDDETTRTWLIFGDPSMQIRTDIPQQLTASHNAIIPFGLQNIAIACPTDGAKFCLSNGDTIFDVATVQNGMVSLTIPQNLLPLDTLFVTGTMFNYIPYQAQVTFSQYVEPYILLKSVYFTDNQENIINPTYAKNCNLNLTVQNIGQQMATETSVEVTISDPYITTNNTQSQVFNLNSFEEYQIINISNLQIANNVPYGYQLPITFTIRNNGTTKDTTFMQRVYAPVPEITDLVVIDENSNAIENGSLDIAENAILQFTLANNGDAAAVPGSVLLESITRNLSINRPLNSMESLLEEESKSLNFRVSVKNDVPANTTEHLRITYSYEGYSISKNFYLVISQTISITEMENKEVSLYPNPTSGSLRIESSQVMQTIQIYDIAGKFIDSHWVNDTSTNININNYKSGIYFIKVLNTEDEIINMQKIIKQ